MRIHTATTLSLTLTGLVLADKRRRPHSRIGKLKIFVEIVQAVQEVPHMPSQYREYAIVTVLTDKSDKVHAHLIEELLFGHPEYLPRSKMYIP